MLDGFKIVSAMCDRYPPFATLINRIPLFPPRMKKEKKPTQMQAAFSINIAGAAKAHYFCHEFFFFRTEKQETYFSALHIHVVIDVTIWSVTRV